ncbi:MAG: helix-turn-helix domain-containing protein [Pseudonocardiaceae bacterium]
MDRDRPGIDDRASIDVTVSCDAEEVGELTSKVQQSVELSRDPNGHQRRRRGAGRDEFGRADQLIRWVSSPAVNIAAPPPIRPEVWEQPAMRTALAQRDIGRVYQLLTAAGISQHNIARLTRQSQSEVSEILSGRQVKQVDVLERICDGLGAERSWMRLADDSKHNAYAGKDEALWEAVTEEMKRRYALALASMAVWGRPVLGELLTLPAPADAPLPSRLVMADVEAVRDLTVRLRSLARLYGGQTDVLSHAAARCTRLLTVPAAKPIQRALAVAVTELHTTAGYAGFDSQLDDVARHHWRIALDLGRDAPHWQVFAIWTAGRLTDERGHPNDALKLHQLALLRGEDAAGNDPRLPVIVRLVRADAALAYARLGHPELARGELTAAADGWAPGGRADQAMMDEARAAVAIELGDLNAAEPFAASALRLRAGSGYEREAALTAVTLAIIHVQAGEPDGSMLADRALSAVARLRSARARDRLGPLGEALTVRGGSTNLDLAQRAATARQA